MLNVQKFVFSDFMENTYIVWDEQSKETAVIDPGCYTPQEEKQLADFITANSLNLKYLINTHCHIDHIFGNAFVSENYVVKFLAPEHDLFLLDLMKEQATNFGVELKDSPKPDILIREDTKIDIGFFSPKFLSTPGHTPDEYSIYFENEKICFSGDVLFYEGIGRTDLWGGDFDKLIGSIKNKLFVMPDDTEVYPGHGDKTTIGHEKIHNPFLT
jgi:glyoxylase-like metal-dependent hydrolase (beta-lactamase superfamily II)